MKKVISLRKNGKQWIAGLLMCCLLAGSAGTVFADEAADLSEAAPEVSVEEITVDSSADDFTQIPVPETETAVSETETVVSETEAEEAVEEELLETVAAPSVTYRTHVQSFGWQDWKKDGAMSGTQGKAKRLEGIEIKVQGSSSLGIRYKTHIQSYGWENAWKADGQMSGTSGEAKRLEAIRIQLTGNDASKYDVWYCVHAQHYGWLNWAKNGADAGTAGYAYRLEGIKIKILPKGSAAPAKEGSCTSAFYSKGSGPSLNTSVRGIAYNTHVQTYGWQDYVYNGTMSGTQGQAKRLEGIHIVLTDPEYSGGVQYQTHIQTYGWQGWRSDGVMSGTSGEAKRLEAIQIRLTGEMANKYDVYYRVHAQHFGWMGWAKNGEQAGTAGYAYRLEGIQIVLVKKGGAAPDYNYGGKMQTTIAAFSKNTQKTFPSLKSLGINYGDSANSKVDRELRKLYSDFSANGVDFDKDLSDYEKAVSIVQYIGSTFSYGDGSYNAESMIDRRYGTCFAYSDLTYCFARKVGLKNTWLTVAGRNINHGNKFYGSQHRTVVALIDGKYYDLDANMVNSMMVTYETAYRDYGILPPQDAFLPEQISKNYADYLRGATNTVPSKIP